LTGKLDAARGEHREALRHFTEAMRLAREFGQRREESNLALLMAASHEALENLPRALDHYKLHLAIRNELDEDGARRAIARMQSRLEVERAEREHELLLRRSEQLRRERDVKEQELAAISLHLVQKSAFLDQLTTKVKVLATHPGTETRRLARGILNDLAAQSMAGENWRRFERQLEALHPAYLRALTTEFSGLTPAEIRVCCLLRLNLPTKDIAAILGASVRTIESHRRYIRHKLRLPAGTNLSLYLATL
jgi:DNA-binding CsgD family transcriptional regulator